MITLTANGPYRGFKSWYHEGGIRVPAAARWPGVIAAGQRVDEMLHAVDLFPTFCRLAGAAAEKVLPLDGRDAWDTIAASAPSPRNEIVHSLEVIRQGDWKLIEKGASYYNWEAQPLQLYNIREDPREERNRAEELPELVARLRDRLAYHRRFAREEEPPARIPGGPPAVYGEEENARYGDWVRKKVKELGLTDQDTKAQRRGRRTPDSPSKRRR